MFSTATLLLTFNFLVGVSLTDCDDLLDSYRDEALQLDYQSFDQTPGSGFRLLAGKGCSSQAADLIEAYIEANDSSQRSLIWHVAQLRGESGDTQAALQAARRSLDPEENSEAPFRWNAHVRAYIAFLEENRESFDRNLQELTSSVELHRGNGMNASMWQNLEPHFELGYAQALRAAYGKQEEENEVP